MRTSSIRLIRKIAGIVLVVINLLLSVMSALAMYSIVEFASDGNNYKFRVDNPITYDFTISPNGYLNLGNMSVNNTGIFAFEDFEIQFEIGDMKPNGTVVPLMNYTGRLEDVQAGEKKDIPISFINNTATDSRFWVSTALSSLPSINATIGAANITGYLRITGKYVLSLFRFDFSFRNLTTWTWI